MLSFSNMKHRNVDWYIVPVLSDDFEIILLQATKYCTKYIHNQEIVKLVKQP